MLAWEAAMPNQPRRSSVESRPKSPSLAPSFDRDEWELLVTLPRRVLIAAGTARRPHTGPSVAEGLAGIEAIAAGRGSPSPLVREVVTAIFAESYYELPEQMPGVEGGLVQTLAACRYASEILAQRSVDSDAAAYRDWLRSIAGEVAGASAAASMSERFLYALAGVLRP
jgi:hypothetical protein